VPASVSVQVPAEAAPARANQSAAVFIMSKQFTTQVEPNCGTYRSRAAARTVIPYPHEFPSNE